MPFTDIAKIECRNRTSSPIVVPNVVYTACLSSPGIGLPNTATVVGIRCTPLPHRRCAVPNVDCSQDCVSLEDNTKALSVR